MLGPLFWIKLVPVGKGVEGWHTREHWRRALDNFGGCPLRVLDFVALCWGDAGEVTHHASHLLYDSFSLTCGTDERVGRVMRSMATACTSTNTDGSVQASASLSVRALLHAAKVAEGCCVHCGSPDLAHDESTCGEREWPCELDPTAPQNAGSVQNAVPNAVPVQNDVPNVVLDAVRAQTSAREHVIEATRVRTTRDKMCAAAVACIKGGCAERGPAADERGNQRGPAADERGNQRGPAADERGNQRGPAADSATSATSAASSASISSVSMQAMQRLARDVKRRFVSTMTATQLLVDRAFEEAVAKSSITRIRTEFPVTAQIAAPVVVPNSKPNSKPNRPMGVVSSR